MTEIPFKLYYRPDELADVAVETMHLSRLPETVGLEPV